MGAPTPAATVLAVRSISWKPASRSIPGADQTPRGPPRAAGL